jgi:hypothetical protein
MLAPLLVAAALAGQAAPAAAPPVDTATAMSYDPLDTSRPFVNPAVAHTAARRKQAAARKRAQRVNRAIQERYAAEQYRREQERLAPLLLQAEAVRAQQYYQYQAGAALQDLGIAARQNAATNRLRAVGELGPGYIPALNAPRVITPAEVIQSQLGR